MTIERIIEGGVAEYSIAQAAQEEFIQQYWNNDFVNTAGIGGTNEYFLRIGICRNDGDAEQFVRNLPEYIRNVPVHTYYCPRIKKQ